METGARQPNPRNDQRYSQTRKNQPEAKKRLVEQKNEEPTSVNWKLALPILAPAADENSDELQDL
jgi:hypothetical protein